MNKETMKPCGKNEYMFHCIYMRKLRGKKHTRDATSEMKCLHVLIEHVVRTTKQFD